MWAIGELGEELWDTLGTNTPEDLRPKIQSIQPKRQLSEPGPWSWPRPLYSQTSVLHVPWLRDRPSHQGLPHLPRVKEENGSRLCESFTIICTQRSQPHHAIEPSPSAILSIISFAFFTMSLPKQLSTTSSILSILPLRHNQPSTASANSTNNIPSTSSTDYISPNSSANHLPSAKQ
jgi:hypothetical protein